MTKSGKPSELAEAALALDQELRRFEELAAQAGRVKLDTQRNLERATDALARAAESLDRMQAQVQRLVGSVIAARQRQEAGAGELMARAQRIAARRAEFTEAAQRMASLGQMTKEVQEQLQAGADLDGVQKRMEELIAGAAEIGGVGRQKQMEDVTREADALRQQLVAVRNKVGLLARRKA
jgi:hypothetical protein